MSIGHTPSFPRRSTHLHTIKGFGQIFQDLRLATRASYTSREETPIPIQRLKGIERNGHCGKIPCVCVWSRGFKERPQIMMITVGKLKFLPASTRGTH